MIHLGLKENALCLILFYLFICLPDLNYWTWVLSACAFYFGSAIKDCAFYF